MFLGHDRRRVVDEAELALALLQPFLGFPTALVCVTVGRKLGFQRRNLGCLHDKTSCTNNA
jgi:hypothetical protein